MEIRTATKEDLGTIMRLGVRFGHLMLYQTSREIMEKYLPRILVAEIKDWREHPELVDQYLNKGVVGYYHYIVSGDPGFEEMLRCYRQFPETLVREAVSHIKYPEKLSTLSDTCYECLRDTDMPDCPLPEEDYQKCERRLKETLVGKLCICMQGASHREVFREFIKHLQEIYPEVWCYCSVLSHRPEAYEQLGFHFNPSEAHTFFNVHKGGKSTYRLGRWKR